MEIKSNTAPTETNSKTSSSNIDKEYKYGFSTELETETVGKGLNEDIIRIISEKKNEPQWMLDYRLKAFEYWKTLKEPEWANLDYPKIDYQDGKAIIRMRFYLVESRLYILQTIYRLLHKWLL